MVFQVRAFKGPHRTLTPFRESALSSPSLCDRSALDLTRISYQLLATSPDASGRNLPNLQGVNDLRSDNLGFRQHRALKGPAPHDVESTIHTEPRGRKMAF
jgi:hypothetical protein